MKYYISDIIPKIQRLSRQLDEVALIQNHHWVLFNDSIQIKTTYIFRENNDLIISESGQVKKAKWDYLGNQTILIENSEESLLFKNSFLDETILVLNLHNTDTYAFFLNETKIGINFKSIQSINEYLDNKYGTGESEKRMYNNSLKFEYTEGISVSDFDIILGSHILTRITYSNGQIGNIMKGKSSGKYFYLNAYNGVTYCKDKEDCIYQLYLNLKGNLI